MENTTNYQSRFCLEAWDKFKEYMAGIHGDNPIPNDDIVTFLCGLIGTTSANDQTYSERVSKTVFDKSVEFTNKQITTIYSNILAYSDLIFQLIIMLSPTNKKMVERALSDIPNHVDESTRWAMNRANDILNTYKDIITNHNS